jgi:hypothetical protein
MTAQRESPPSQAEHLRQAFATSRGDRDRAMEAMRTLEAAAGQAGPGRDQAWRQAVIAGLGLLLDALTEQQASYQDPTSLMAQIAQDEPRLRTWVRQLQHRWGELAATTRTLIEGLQAAETEDTPSVADVREQLRWLINAIHHHRAREADLIFDALGTDIAVA